MPSRSLAVILLTLACATRHDGDGTTEGSPPGSASSTGTSLASSGGLETTGTTTTATTGLSTGEPTTNPFIMTPDDGVGGHCDEWTQDCPEGQKCAPVSVDGNPAWDMFTCVDVVPRPDGVGQPCVVFDVAGGLDSCGEGLLCLGPDAGTSKCVALCSGPMEAPTCPDPSSQCAIARFLSLCLPSCDPLAQDCARGDLCLPNASNPLSWTCVLDASGVEGQLFDACEYANACDPGLLCLPPELAAECDPAAFRCCLPLCDLEQPNTCPGQGQQCVAWYAPGDAPPGKDHLGQCALP